MSAVGKAAVQTIERDKAIANFEDILTLTGDAGMALEATGRRYEQMRRSLLRAGRDDLAEPLREWKLKDSERLHDALGKSWTGGKPWLDTSRA